MLITTGGSAGRGVGGLSQESHSPTQLLDDVMHLALKNIDDESPFCAAGWAEVLARCMSTAVQYNEQIQADSAGNRNVEQDEEGRVRSSSNDFDATTSGRFGSRNAPGLAQTCSSLKAAMGFLVEHFIKVGGELGASRAGGTFSVGGRAVRIGVGLTMTQLLRLGSELGSIGTDAGVPIEEIVPAVLELMGPEMERQLIMPGHADSASGPVSPLFGSARRHSPSDPCLVRMAASRVLRQGLSELASESIQLGMLQDLVDMMPQELAAPKDSKEGASKTPIGAVPVLNANQLQVILIEMSHLIATLGEAAASKVEDLLAKFDVCLVHEAMGVRHESAVACAALTASFPSEGRKLVRSNLDAIQNQHAQLMKSTSMKDSKEEHSKGLRMFRRQSKQDRPVDQSLPYQHAIHGRCLMVSMLIRALPRLPGGLPVSLLSAVLPVAEILVSCQFNDLITKASQAGACMCVRAGFGIISGVLSTGPNGAAPHIPLIFGAWQKACNSAKTGGKNFAPRHDLFCLDSILSSMVTFLKYCSELLLSIPDALSQTTLMLEEIMMLFLPQGRIGSIQLSPPVAARLESATASLLESFAWLPSGSFPMAVRTLTFQ
jgi:hypothetical protein